MTAEQRPPERPPEPLPDPAITRGARIGEFVVSDVLGALDGAWTVADGLDADGRPVLIWFSTVAAAIDPHVRERVGRLARMGAAPGIGEQPLARLRAACGVRGRLVVVREIVPGATLRDRLDEGPLSLAEAMLVLCRVATALDVLHRFGVVHTYLTPSVVMPAPRPSAGALLQSYGFPAPPGPPHADAAFEELVPYLAPELADGGSPDARADVYALACLLVECLTGRPPFPRDRPGLVLDAHAGETPPTIAGAHDLPAALDDVLQVALSKNPEDRHGSPGELMQDVVRAFQPEAAEDEAEPVPEPAPEPEPPEPEPAVAVAAPEPPAEPEPEPAPAVHEPVTSAPRARPRTMPPRAATAALLAAAAACGFGVAAVHPGSSGGDASATRPAAGDLRPAVFTAVDRTMDRLAAERAQGRRAMQRAGGPRQQAAAATSLSRSYRAARLTLPAPAVLALAAPAPELAQRLGGVERAYRAMAASALAGDQSGFARTRRLVVVRERRLDATLGNLARAARSRRKVAP